MAKTPIVLRPEIVPNPPILLPSARGRFRHRELAEKGNGPAPWRRRGAPAPRSISTPGPTVLVQEVPEGTRAPASIDQTTRIFAVVVCEGAFLDPFFLRCQLINHKICIQEDRAMAGVKGRSGGHNRKPVGVHLLAGTYRRDRHGPVALVADPARAVPPGGRPEPPPGLSVDSNSLWRRLLDEYEGWGPADFELLQVGLEALDRHRECRERIAVEGVLLKSPRGGLLPHPLLRVQRDAGASVAAIFKQLGLGASAPASQGGAA
jgi:P27 family predicted phage terminase small subunit